MFPTRVFLLKKPRLRAPLRMMDNLQHWRNRAADTLARLEETKDPTVRDILVRLYVDYVRMVRFEEGQLRRRRPPTVKGDCVQGYRKSSAP